MNLLELFSGIGGFSLGLQQAGFTFDKVYFSEIDRHAIANFKHNFQNAQHVGSVCDITRASIERPDIITFGSPCQNFSAAGNGLGLRGAESSLVRYAVQAIDYFRPDIFVWENVKASSSNDIAGIFGKSSRPLPTLGFIKSNGNCLILHGYYPKIGRESTLSAVLQKNAGTKYFLSAKAFSRLKKRQTMKRRIKIVVVRL